MRRDPLCWQLALVRERVNPETGKREYYSVPDTAANRNAGRFAKMPKKRDEFAGHGHGIVYEPVRPTRAMIQARRIDGCARTFAPADAPATIVVPTKITKRMRRALPK